MHKALAAAIGLSQGWRARLQERKQKARASGAAALRVERTR
jgi:hypothetical protein